MIPTKHDFIKPPGLPFRWRDGQGNFHPVKSMETRHLFFTLRMIWNHTMPAEARIEPYRRYRFAPFYTRDYMTRAVRSIFYELQTRKDIKPSWQADLDRMRDYFIKKIEQEVKKIAS